MVLLRPAATLLTVVMFTWTARAATAPATQSWPPQLQLQMQVPFEPSAFPSAGHTCLTYELYLSNFESRPVTIDRVDVLDADDSKPIATFEGEQLNTILHRMGTPKGVLAKDGIAQNIPGHFGRDSLASGNTIALDLGDHQFAHYVRPRYSGRRGPALHH